MQHMGQGVYCVIERDVSLHNDVSATAGRAKDWGYAVAASTEHVNCVVCNRLKNQPFFVISNHRTVCLCVVRDDGSDLYCSVAEELVDVLSHPVLH